MLIPPEFIRCSNPNRAKLWSIIVCHQAVVLECLNSVLKTLSPAADASLRPQVEMLMMISRLTNRSLVLPEHLDVSIDHLRGVALVSDFWDFDHMRGFIRTISMQDYLDIRCVVVRCKEWVTM